MSVAVGASPQKHPHGDHLTGRRACVVIVSTSAAEGRARDLCGPRLHKWLVGQGLEVDPLHVIEDGPGVEALLRDLLQSQPRPRFIITSGGTGLNPDDVTPEATAALLDREAPGVMHALWSHGLTKTPTAGLSRGVAGHAGSTFMVNLPGSPGGVRDGIHILDGLLEHISIQLEDIHGHELQDLARQLPHPELASTAPAVSHGPGVSATALAESPAPATSEAPITERVTCAEVTEKALDSRAAQNGVSHPACGAVVAFSGVIRNHHGGRHGVTGLEYSAHPSATDVMQDVVHQVAAEHPDVRIWAQHRIGSLQVGDSALEVAVASAHRAAAFTVCDLLVEQIKAKVPIWKRQTFTDGTHSWVGLDD